MFPAVVEPTVEVVTMKFPDEEPEGTVTETGTVAAVLALASPTVAPAAGATVDKVTVPVLD